MNELGDIRQLPLGIALMVLTTLDESQAPEEARYLLSALAPTAIANIKSRHNGIGDDNHGL